MKKTVKAILSASLALILALSSLPFAFTANAAEPQPAWTVPEGYNAHDYTKCVEFLEQTDEEGIKNGDKINENYDPNDPSTWGSELEKNYALFLWTSVEGEQRISTIILDNNEGLCGTLDVSYCTALDYLHCENNSLTAVNVSGCTALMHIDCENTSITELNVSGCTALIGLYCFNNRLAALDVSSCAALSNLNCEFNCLSELNVSNNTSLIDLRCGDNRLTELDVSGCTALEILYCDNNNLIELDVTDCTALNHLGCGYNSLSELDVSSCTALEYLTCNDNRLTELDVSECTGLRWLTCYDNYFIELDLSNNSHLSYNHILVDGRGFVGYKGYMPGFEPTYTGTWVYAYPMNGASFEGFFDADSELVSHGEWSNADNAYVYHFNYSSNGTLIARFSGGSAVIPGDVDGSGSVTTADAIITLRLALQLIDGSGMNVDAADMDGNSSVSIADAIMVLRVALGL